MNSDKVLRYMGLAKRAGHLGVGFNTCEAMMKKKEIKLFVIAEDLSDNSKDKVRSLAKSFGVELLEYSSMEKLSQITGEENSGVFGVKDKNLAEAIKKEIAISNKQEVL